MQPDNIFDFTHTPSPSLSPSLYCLLSWVPSSTLGLDWSARWNHLPGW